MRNIMTFDVEAWCDSFYLTEGKADLKKYGDRAGVGVAKILSLLKSKNLTATFFITGKLAEANPNLVKSIALAGHEVASHGYAHLPIYAQSPAELKKDLLLSIKILKEITGQAILGYRAPGYTVTKDTLWALDIIKECGLRYDSSIYPVSLRVFTRGGAAGFPQQPFYVKEQLAEFPLITANLFGARLPVATTSYFRIFPYGITKWAIKQLNQKGTVACLNFHSWEFDKHQPRVKLPFPQNFKHYINLSKTEERFKKLINDFDFTNCRESLVLVK